MIGQMSEIITLLRRATGEDGYGGSPNLFAKLTDVFAEVTPVRATESEREGALRDVQVYLFRVYRRNDITTSDAIEWGGRRFNIREVRLPPHRNLFMTLVGETGVTQ